jgi:hypothetical protein
MRLRAAQAQDDPWSVVRREVTMALCGFMEDFDPDLRRECLSLWLNESAPRRRYLEIVMEWESVLSEYLEPHLAPSATRTLELQLLAASISSALRAALNTAMQTNEDVRALIDRAFNLIESGISSNLLLLAPRAESSGASRRRHSPGG